MIQVKLFISPIKLEHKKKDQRFKEFIDCINNELTEPIEIVHEKDATFSGYYLFFESNYLPDVNYNTIDKKTFLIGVDHPDDDVINECKPVGYIDYRNYMAKTPIVYGQKGMLQDAGIELGIFNYYGYNSVILHEKDGTYKPMVKSVFEYLEIYDKYLKNQ